MREGDTQAVPAPQLVMLDFDGVIVDSLDATCDAAVQFLEQHGMRHLASRDAVLGFVDHNWYEGIALAGLPPDLSRALDLAVLDAITRRIEQIPAVPGMPEAIRRLSDGNTVVVITSNFSDFAGALLRRHGIGDVVEIMGADHETSKVTKIRRALARYPHPGGRWYVGDTVGDIVEARQAGVPSIAATWGWHSPDRLMAASPDAVARDPRELVRIVGGAGG